MRLSNLFSSLTASVGVGGMSLGYSPESVQCPAGIPLRKAEGRLSDGEQSWLTQRDSVAMPALREWIGNSGLQDFDHQSYLADSTIRVGLAFSGGGFRAMLVGAGEIAAMDKNTPGSDRSGGFGGLLQASTYISGLSGGSWLVGSLAMNNWTSVPIMQRSKYLWNFQNPFTITDDRRGLFSMLRPSWDLSVAADVIAKQNAGFPISIPDVWGRLLSSQLFPGLEHGRNLLWSDLLAYDQIVHYSMPLPIITIESYNTSMPIHFRNTSGADRLDYRPDVSVNSTVFEVSPFEFGSWDPTLSSFVSTQYMGSKLSSTTEENGCVTGYDNIGFLVGASSTLFNTVIDQVLGTPGLKAIYTTIINALGQAQDAVYALVGPNSFQGLTWATPGIENSDVLRLVDGGEGGLNIPLEPLSRPERHIDVIFAFDNSADTQQRWPNATALYLSSLRSRSPQGNGVPFPFVPHPNTLVKLGLTQKPVFFGCQIPGNKTVDDAGPIVAWIPNSQRSYRSNQDTFKLNYTPSERDEMIRNGYNVMTQNNGTIDSEWRSCVACITLLRELQRRGDQPTSQCTGCYDNYCYIPK